MPGASCLQVPLQVTLTCPVLQEELQWQPQVDADLGWLPVVLPFQRSCHSKEKGETSPPPHL